MASLVTLNVGGKSFTTTKETLTTYPETRLGHLVAENKQNDQDKLELFFDRNPKMMNSILDFYRTGELHIPKTICPFVVERELEFWGIPLELIRCCCWTELANFRESMKVVEEIDRFVDDPYGMDGKTDKFSVCEKIWLLLDYPNSSFCAKVWHLLYFLLVFGSVLTYVMQSSLRFRQISPEIVAHLPYSNATWEQLTATLPPLNLYRVTDPLPWLQVAEVVSFSFFGVEFLLRLAVCPRKATFLKQPKNLLDLLLLMNAIISTVVLKRYLIITWDMSGTRSYIILTLGVLSKLRVLRILYLAKDFNCMKILWLSAKSSVKELSLLVICTLSFVTLFGAVVFMTELFSGHNTFSSIAAGMWWAIVTMTTVGYGDVYPVSPWGQMVGAVCALSGVILLALPVTIIASRFSSYHSNMSSRQRKKTKLAFLNSNPQFSKRSGLCRKSPQEETIRVFTHDQTHADKEEKSIVTKNCGDTGKHRCVKTIPRITKVHPKSSSEG